MKKNRGSREICSSDSVEGSKEEKSVLAVCSPSDVGYGVRKQGECRGKWSFL